MDSKRTLELTVLSLEELHVDWKHAVESLYVAVRAESITSYATGTATKGGGSGNPSWNEKLVVDVPVHARSITLEVKCKNAPSVKDVGIARIAISDFLGGGTAAPEQCLQFLSYRLRDWEGRHSGVINFSVRVRATEKACSCSGDVVIGVPNLMDKVKVCLELGYRGGKSITLKHSLFSIPFFFSRGKHDFFHPWQYMAQVSIIINRIVCVHLSFSVSLPFLFYFNLVRHSENRSTFVLAGRIRMKLTHMRFGVQHKEFGSMNTSFTS